MSGTEKEKFGSHLTHEDRVRNGAIGGKKKGENARKRREMKEAIELLLSMPLENKKVAELEQIVSFANLKNKEGKIKNLTVNDALIVKQVQKAMKGDLNALIFLRDTVGEKPKENVSMNMNLPVFFDGEDDLEE